jgi:hypothetical protein
MPRGQCAGMAVARGLGWFLTARSSSMAAVRRALSWTAGRLYSKSKTWWHAPHFECGRSMLAGRCVWLPRPQFGQVQSKSTTAE